MQYSETLTLNLFVRQEIQFVRVSAVNTIDIMVTAGDTRQIPHNILYGR